MVISLTKLRMSTIPSIVYAMISQIRDRRS